MMNRRLTKIICLCLVCGLLFSADLNVFAGEENVSAAYETGAAGLTEAADDAVLYDSGTVPGPAGEEISEIIPDSAGEESSDAGESAQTGETETTVTEAADDVPETPETEPTAAVVTEDTGSEPENDTLQTAAAESAESVTESAESAEPSGDTADLTDVEEPSDVMPESAAEEAVSGDIPETAEEQELQETIPQDPEETDPANEDISLLDTDSQENETAAATDNVQPLEEPGQLTARCVSNGIRLQWAAVEGASGYRIYRWDPSARAWEACAEVQTVSYTDTQVQAAAEYRYTVQAFHQDNESTYLQDGVTGVYIPGITISKITTDGRKVTITWPAVTNADGYRICWRYQGDKTWKKWKDVTATSFTGNGGTLDKTYEYQILPYKTLNGVTWYAAYNDSHKAVCRMLSAPVLKSAKSTSTGITIRWTAVSGAKGYNIYYWNTKTKAWKKFATSTITSYTDTKTKTGVRYWYTVQAYDSTGVSLYDEQGLAAAYLPSVSFSASSVAAGGITCSWNAIPEADGYRIYWRFKGDSKWRKWKDTTETSFTDKAKSLVSSKTYEYMLWPYVVRGGKQYFGTWDESFMAQVYWLPAPVLKSAKSAENGVQITWSPVTGASGYDIYWWHPTQKKWKKFASTSNTSYVDTTAKTGTVYWYTVRAKTNTGAGAYDKTGLAAAYLPAVKITSMRYTGTAVKFSWDKVSGASGYRLYWRVPGGKWRAWKYVTDTTYTDTTAKKGSTYEYGVWAYVEKGGNKYFGCWDDGSWQQVTAVKNSDPVLEKVSLGTGVVYYISTALGNKVLDVTGASTADGANIQLYSNNGSGAQMWVIQGTDEDGYFTIRNIRSWNCLTVSGSNVEQSRYTGSNAQLWTFVPTGDGNGTCYIINKNGNYLRIASGSSQNGANVETGSSGTSAAEKFSFASAGQGSGVDFSIDGSQTIGFRSFYVNDGTVTETDGYYPINTEIILPSGGYSLSTANIGLKVMYVNSYLASHGYLDASYISYNRYDANTAAAVQRFQAANGLAVDGVVGLYTWTAMGYSTDEWYNLGTYVTPLKVNKFASSRSDYIEAMVNTAAEYAGSNTGFRDGASGEPGTYVDCSGLIYQCLYAAGINPSTNIVDHALAVYEYTSRYLAADGRLGQVVSSAQRGDLIFYGSGGVVNHVAISAGGGLIYDSWPGIGVTLRSQYSPGTILKIIRPF